MLKLKPTDHVIREGGHFISVFIHKTREHNVIPIPDFLGEIFNSNKKTYGNILPPRNYQKVRSDLPKIFRRIEGARIPYAKYRTVNGKYTKVKEGKLWEFITPHWLRRTAVSVILLRSGMSETAVKKIGGWTQNSTAFPKYVDLAQDFINDEMRKVHEKILAGTGLRV